MENKFYITTPLYYVNDKPHIGHAYTTVLADMFHRFHKFCGYDAFFLTGTDEHGEKIAKTAGSFGRGPKEHVDLMVERFKEAWDVLGIDYTFFIRTTDSFHKDTVSYAVKKLLDSGDIFKASYEGWYCVPCESFWKEELLVDGKCPDCGRDVEKLKEENYFFKLAKYQEWLINYINGNEDFIFPKGKRSEVLSFLKNPLEDLCISRPKSRLEWGIPFPGDEDFVIYVWFDALLNYISAVGYGYDKNRFNKYWPADIQIIGKDILRQHAVYWPIMLKALGVPMPKMIIAHGWWTVSGSKISKSRGNAVDPVEMAEAYGVDTFRYYMIREATLGSDGAYSEELLIERLNSDLANDLGNLVYRSVSMLGKYFDSVLPAPSEGFEWDIAGKACGIGENLRKKISEEFDPRGAISEVWALVSDANRFIEEVKPWALNKEGKKEELASFIYTLLEVIRIIGVALYPFMPGTSGKILRLFSVNAEPSEEMFLWGLLSPGIKVERGEPLFPKIDEE